MRQCVGAIIDYLLLDLHPSWQVVPDHNPGYSWKMLELMELIYFQEHGSKARTMEPAFGPATPREPALDLFVGSFVGGYGQG